MTRIIAGRLRAVELFVPAEGTRPTTDRVREALFSAIEARLDLMGVAVLDLFAGSGALGLEAVSRGAVACDGIDYSAQALRALNRNFAAAGARLNAAGVSDVRLRAHRAKLPDYLAGRCPQVGGYDLVFADPPYEEAAGLQEILASLVAGGWLSEIAFVVLETSARHQAPQWPQDFGEVFHRVYGETRLQIAEWMP